MTIQIASSAFDQGQGIPRQYTGEGNDLSPPLVWSNLPKGTKELALICDDPDAPTKEPWVHWVIYKISAETKGLPEGIARKARPKEVPGALQGINSWTDADATGYRGPLPPRGSGAHHYHFKVYSLDAALDAEPGLDKSGLLKAMQGHILAEGELIGTYERKK
jgi:Raf kinase inhibitor-like YbhB/YbcL family protein